MTFEGLTNSLILAHLLRGPCYAYKLSKDIDVQPNQTGVNLKRFVKEGYIESYYELVGHYHRKMYKLTESGVVYAYIKVAFARKQLIHYCNMLNIKLDSSTVNQCGCIDDAE